MASDIIIVPSRMDLSRSTAGIAPSENGQGIVLWLGRIDSNALTRISVNEDGTQRLQFFDKRGRLGLNIGLDATGQTQMRVFDEDDKVHSIAQ